MTEECTIVFDFYGTLFSCPQVYPHPYEQLYKRLASLLNHSAAEVRRVLMITAGDDLACCCYSLTDGKLTDDLRTSIAAAAREASSWNASYAPLEIVVGSLRQLIALGRSVSILSNAAEFMAPTTLASQLRCAVECKFSYRIGWEKPTAEAFRAAAQGTAIMVGDNWSSDVLGALRQGWGAVYFDPLNGPLAQLVLALQHHISHGTDAHDPRLACAIRALGLGDFAATLRSSLQRVRVCTESIELTQVVEELYMKLCL